MARKKMLLGNWKMNHTIRESKDFCENFKDVIKLADRKNVVLGVFPSFISLNTVRRNLPFSVIVGAQDVSNEEKGAFTGSISIPMIRELSVNSSLVGHSERRMYQAETSELCNKKIRALLDNNMIPVYCVGETEIQYEQGITNSVIKDQLVKGLKGINPNEVTRIVIAYEPVWSIGTGKNASSEIAHNVCSFIRKTLAKLYSKEVSEEVTILYGGSVKPENIHNYMTTGSIDGALVGGASLKVDSFRKLVENF